MPSYKLYDHQVIVCATLSATSDLEKKIWSDMPPKGLTYQQVELYNREYGKINPEPVTNESKWKKRPVINLDLAPENLYDVANRIDDVVANGCGAVHCFPGVLRNEPVRIDFTYIGSGNKCKVYITSGDSPEEDTRRPQRTIGSGRFIYQDIGEDCPPYPMKHVRNALDPQAAVMTIDNMVALLKSGNWEFS